MALPSTDPNTLNDTAKCFNKCIPVGDQLGVQTYLLALIAGQDVTNPSAIADAAKCFNKCIPPGDQIGTQNYLLVQILS